MNSKNIYKIRKGIIHKPILLQICDKWSTDFHKNDLYNLIKQQKHRDRNCPDSDEIPNFDIQSQLIYLKLEMEVLEELKKLIELRRL